MQHLILSLAAIVLIGCGANTPDPSPQDVAAQTPPPLPENAETVVFERVSPIAETPSGSEKKTVAAAASSEPDDGRPLFWGVAEGEAVPVMWEDLMPEGSEEELVRQYEEFYAMLEKRYAANSTLLSQADPYGGIAEGSELDFMPQLGTFDVVEELDGERIRIPGYVVPFDFSTNARHAEFLFVPYMGACIHSPPPPPNQLILARADPKVRVDNIWAPYWLEGTLHTETTENELGDTAYTMTMDALEPYMMQ